LDRSKFYNALEDLLELDPGTVKGDESLVDLAGWDSMAMVGFIAMVDETYGIIVSANRLIQCKTAADLAKLVEDSQST
jgi:acyl carrier protein